MNLAADRPLVLLVLDGFGIGAGAPGDATVAAKMPVWRDLRARWPHAELEASGVAVGLPEGQMGNSEVGHLNIGSGQRVPQELPRINAAIANGTFSSQRELHRALRAAEGGRLHLCSLLGPGGVHAHDDHLVALATAAEASGVRSVYLHLFLDGRDTPPRSALGYLADLEERLARFAPQAKIASVAGRYFAMDRDQRWERTARAVAAIAAADGIRATSARDAIEQGYTRGESDEFVAPTVTLNGQESEFRPGDVLIHANFRADRARQLVAALSAPTFTHFERPSTLPVSVWGISSYGDATATPAIFGPAQVPSLASAIADVGLRQFHVAETEKYAHVTYFFNGGQEAALTGERRMMIASLPVSTYDRAPEMRAAEIASAVVSALAEGSEAFVLANLANADMVGHTGDFGATVRACEAVDHALGRIAEAVLARPSATLVVTADHGNAERMVTAEGEPVTSHTLARVPILIAGDRIRGHRLMDGALEDVAPTICALTGLALPPTMTGRSLLVRV
ncbi:MAG: 2,3-bisphosphoglycerate-independent phosphoglycerate mutase [Candidatus Limnocylindrus sp.]